MELRQYASILLKWLWLIVLGTLLAGATAFLVSKMMTPVYQASTTLLVSPGSSPSTSDYTAVLTGQQLAVTYQQLLNKRSVLEKVIQNLNLPITVDELTKLVDVQVVRSTQLIVVQVENTDPALAAKIANQIATVFIDQNSANQLSRFATSEGNLQAQLKQVENDITTNQAALDKANAATPINQAEVARLETSLAQSRTSYSNLLKSYEDIRIAEAQAINNVTVADAAVPSDRPARPNVLLNTLLAAVVGAMLAVGFAFLIEYLDDSIHSPDEIDEVLHLPMLGTIMRTPSTTPADRLSVQKDPRSPLAESYRSLRTNVQFSNIDQPPKTIVITSANPLEGKSTTAANLAVAMAQSGLSVVLVDADMRRPSQHRIFEVPNDYGLTNVLLQEGIEAKGFVHDTKVDKLGLMTTGPLPPNPSELLGSQRMRNLLGVLKEQFDAVIIDTPPVLAVTDPVVLAPNVDGVILVVGAGETRRDAAQRAASNLNQVGARLLGVALNKLSRNGHSYGYYYYYSPTGEKKRRASERPAVPANGNGSGPAD